MGILTDGLLNILFSRCRDKRYEKERGDEIATSFLIRRALKTGAYLAEEMECQSQDEGLRLRADRAHAVVLGTVLCQVFDIRKECLRTVYTVCPGGGGLAGEVAAGADAVWGFDLCKAMEDGTRPGALRDRVDLCVYYARDGGADGTVAVHLEVNGGDEHTRFIRASMMRPVSTEQGDVSFASAEGRPEALSILFAYDDGARRDPAGAFGDTVVGVVGKYREGKELDADETALVAKLMPEAGWHYSWGHKAFDEKRYWDALLYLGEAFRLLAERWHRGGLSGEGEDIFYHCCYLIGYCYAEMRLYEKAYFYLDYLWPLKEITYCEEYINCLVNGKDVRAMGVIDEELKRLGGMKDEDVTEEVSEYYLFLLRRRAYVLTEMRRLDEAEGLLEKLSGIDGHTEYIRNELDYIRRLREGRQG